MSRVIDELYDRAMELPEEERAELAERLYESMEHIDLAWREEVRRRLDEPDDSVSWETVRESLFDPTLRPKD